MAWCVHVDADTDAGPAWGGRRSGERTDREPGDANPRSAISGRVSRVLDFLSLHSAKGVARMSDIRPRLRWPTTPILFVAATGGASQRLGGELAGHMDCRQSFQ
jgi:hypothetical protein